MPFWAQLTADLELLDKVDPSAALRGHQPQLQVALERAYVETPDTCDAFVTRGVVSQQPEGEQQVAVVATLELTSERWETLA